MKTMQFAVMPSKANKENKKCLYDCSLRLISIQRPVNICVESAPLFLFTSLNSLLVFSVLTDCRRMMTSRKVTCQSTRGLPLPLIFPKWIPPSQRSFWSCLKREELWWFLLQCQEIQLKRRRRRSQACGRVASSMETTTFRGSESLNLLIYLSIKQKHFSC